VHRPGVLSATSLKKRSKESSSYTRIATTTATINAYQNGVFQRTAELDGVLVDHSRGLRAIFKTAGTVITIDGRKTSGQED